MIDVTLGGDKTNVIDWQFLDFDFVFSAGGQADSQSSPFRKRDERPVSNTNTSRKSLTNLSGFTADNDSIGRLGVYN